MNYMRVYLKCLPHESEVRIRKVSKGFKQTAFIQRKFMMIKTWVDYPKASEFASNDNLISFRFKDGTLLITYMVLDTIGVIFKLLSK